MNFSASSYKEYQQCGLKFRYRRIDKIIPPDGEPTHHRWFGRLVHEAVYAGLTHRTGDREYVLRHKPSFQEGLRVFTDVWDHTLTTAVSSSISEAVGEKPSVFQEGKIMSLKGTDREREAGWRSAGISMVKNGIEALYPVHNQIKVLESRLEWEYMGKDFVGYIDITLDNFDFYDLKTPWNKPGAKLQKDFQFFIYSYALKKLHGLDYYPRGFWVHLRDGSLLPFEVTPEIEKMHMEQAEKTFRRIESGIFPSIIGSPLCAFCDFQKLCYGENGYEG